MIHRKHYFWLYYYNFFWKTTYFWQLAFANCEGLGEWVCYINITFYTTISSLKTHSKYKYSRNVDTRNCWGWFTQNNYMQFIFFPTFILLVYLHYHCKLLFCCFLSEQKTQTTTASLQTHKLQITFYYGGDLLRANALWNHSGTAPNIGQPSSPRSIY